MKIGMQLIAENNLNNVLKYKPLKWREHKNVDKYEKIIQHYFDDNMQPKKISQLLNIKLPLVQKVVSKVKYNTKQEQKR